MVEQLSVVGKGLPRVDAVDKVTGATKYATDLKLPGMLYGKMLRSPHAHARIVNIDTTEAERLEGVEAVVSFRDSPRIAYGIIPPPGVQDYYVLDEIVRYVGDRVAAVAAVNEDVAEEAVELIKVQYEPLPAVFDPEKALEPDAPKVNTISSDSNMAGESTFEIGDVERGFKEADHVFEDKFTTHVVQPTPMEPHAAVASFDSSGLVVWHSTQDVFGDREILSKVLDLPLNKVKVIAPPVGGAFGSKVAEVVMLVAALLAKKAGRPIKMECTREEDLVSRTRHPCIMKIKTGVKKDGTITARKFEAVAATGAHADWGPSVMRWMMLSFLGMYKCPNIKFEARAVYTNTPVAGAYRGFGAPQMAFAVESQVDMIAEKIGIDPIEFRLKNTFRAGDRTETGALITSCGLEECMELGANRIGWKESRKKESSGNKRRGIGMAYATYWTGLGKPYNPSQDMGSAIVKLNEDGTALLFVGNPELGQGAHTILAQIVAEELGLRLEDVRVVAADTDTTPYTWGTGGSSRTIAMGNAVRRAAEQAKNQLLREAAKMLNTTIDELRVGDRRIFAYGPDEKAAAISDVVVSCQSTPPTAAVIGTASYGPPQQLAVFVAVFAEVEADIETGETKVHRLVIAEDVGRVMNRATLEGQIEGGIQQGLGYALTEELILDRDGRALNANFLDYKMPGPVEMPKLDIILVESQDPYGPYGAKGVGEVSLVTIAPAIANAIYNATGLRIKEIPITAERLFQALLKGGQT